MPDELTEQERAYAALADDVKELAARYELTDGAFAIYFNKAEWSTIEAALRILAATPATSSDVRERVARAMAVADGSKDPDALFAPPQTMNSPRDPYPVWVEWLGQADAALSAIRPGDRLPAGVVVPEEPPEALLSEFGKRRGWGLSYKCPFYADDDDQEQCWQVTEVRGGINDREWIVLGKGETPADAIRAAIAATKEDA